MSVPSVPLVNGGNIPQVGLGLWQVTDETLFNDMFDAAIEVGYSHFDTAQIYRNERLLGASIKRLNLDRSDLFITTKISPFNFGSHHAPKSFVTSLRDLQTEYVDLLLLHFPVPLLRKASWKALEKLQQSGQAKHIGVSNYTIRHLENLKRYATIMPAVNQVELHVFLQQPQLISYCKTNDIVIEAYSPLAHSRDMNNPTIAKIATKHHKSYAQIMLAWCVSNGLVILPKSKTPSRLRENADVFDIEFDDSDKALLLGLNRNLRTIPNPAYVP
jgi:diketogulonate reductase-like aldo/keto reductase